MLGFDSRAPAALFVLFLAACAGNGQGLDANGIGVEVLDGEVTLGGRVRHFADMQRAEQHACETEGVKLVRNALTLDEASPDAPAAVGGAKPAGAAPKMGKPGYER